ncbi:hypothetical protein RA19_18130 [Leisingera sp. ANG-M1]|uniref:GNAT family N-acetyltransferase n=1 Tax=Leisingera sp. ANG-M1 TaxID=1577895 RepID=UPI000580645A|nr:GNAT family protein [Leisingera sp. ANG-M1]KIC08802.1 hypothetical protein RA19_18130 [Leisingera sp. ANG-M1]
MTRTNHLGQPIGDALPAGWTPPPRPVPVTLEGRFAQIVPLQAGLHGEQLFEAFRKDTDGAGWTYMANGPYDRLDDFMQWLTAAEASTDPMFFAYIDQSTGRAAGYGSFLRIEAAMGCIEAGNIRMSPAMQRTPVSTEAMHLKMAYAFGLGYRRYEWKCDALNAPSRRAAGRLGFTFEGIFRKALHYKGRSRDTAWFSITDDEWPAVCKAHQAWLHPGNFDAEGRQKQPLASFLAPGQPGSP